MSTFFVIPFLRSFVPETSTLSLQFVQDLYYIDWFQIRVKISSELHIDCTHILKLGCTCTQYSWTNTISRELLELLKLDVLLRLNRHDLAEDEIAHNVEGRDAMNIYVEFVNWQIIKMNPNNLQWHIFATNDGVRGSSRARPAEVWDRKRGWERSSERL